MALRGYFPVSELATFDGINSRLQGHPDMRLLPGLDMSSGSLGLGLSAGVGIALGAKLAGKDFATFVMVGDGECNEGVVWESAHIAERYSLDNLIVVVDQNQLQQFGWRADGTGSAGRPTASRSSGIAGRRSAGRSPRSTGMTWPPSSGARRGPGRGGRPVALIAHTVKGKGVSFMESNFRWHSRIPTDEELATALAELSGTSVQTAEA